jgi:hypothetical protein
MGFCDVEGKTETFISRVEVYICVRMVGERGVGGDSSGDLVVNAGYCCPRGSKHVAGAAIRTANHTGYVEQCLHGTRVRRSLKLLPVDETPYHKPSPTSVNMYLPFGMRFNLQSWDLY